MKTNFLAIYPEMPGMATEVYNRLGNSLPARAHRNDARKSQTVLVMDRDTFDSVCEGEGSFRKHRPTCPKAVPGVDFEAEDGTLHLTAEECLKHELMTRFEVSSLDELEELFKFEKLNVLHAEESTNATDCITLIRSSLSQKSRKPEEIVRDTGLDETVVYNTLSQNPDIFKKVPGGRYQLVKEGE